MTTTTTTVGRLPRTAPEGGAVGLRPAAAVLLALALASPAASAQDAAADGSGDVEVLPVTGHTAPGETAMERGEYIWTAAGCASCHNSEEGPPLGGGVALRSDIGVIYASNISPHPEAGIGGWSEQDLVTALREGQSREGAPYYPAFPYTSYTHMTREDISDLYTWIMAQEPTDTIPPENELDFPYSVRTAIEGWQLLAGLERFQPDPDRSALWNRGAYLVRGPGHCGQCHTPRTATFQRDDSLHLAGNAFGLRRPAPNITPDPEFGIGAWDRDDLAFALRTGYTPDGQFQGGEMAWVIRHQTSGLTPGDRLAIADYVMGVDAIDRDPYEDADGETFGE